MKRLIIILKLILACVAISYSQSGTPNTHIDFESTDKGILIPRMDSSVRNAIIPNLNEESLLVYDNNLNKFMYWDGSAWSQIGNKDQYVYPIELNVLIDQNAGSQLEPNLVTQDGRFNVIIGNNAGTNIDTSFSLTAVGNLSGNNNKGAENSFLGAFSGNKNESGFRNTFIGYSAGSIIYLAIATP